jgi:tetratricopeptide (TPR) repeat protein
VNPIMTDAPFRWIETDNWELEFFGLPNRIPWPADVDPAEARKDPFEMNHLLDAIEAMGAEAPAPWSNFLKASVHLEDFGEAIQNSEIVRAYELLEGFENEHPDTAFAMYHRGSLARLEGDDEGAIELFRAAAEKAPRGVAIWNSIGVVEATSGHRDGAVAAFRKALEVSPQDRTALEGLAGVRGVVKLLRKENDPDSAIYVDLPTFGKMALQQVGRLQGPEQLLDYGEQLLKEGFAPEAGLLALEKAYQAKPEDPRAVFSMTTGYRMQQKLAQARATITKYTDQHADDPRGFFQLAQICHEQQDQAGEDAALDRVLEIDPNAQAPLGIRFKLTDKEHDPAKEDELAAWGEKRNSWMAFVLASNVARQRGAAKPAVKWAERAYALAPEVEDVVLHYTAALGEARDFEKLVSVIKPLIDSGKFSKRLNWNYAQTLQQSGLVEDAIRVLRDAATGDAPEDFKAAVAQTVAAWSGELTGCGVQLEVHQSGFLQRPVLLTIDDEDGGVVLAAGAKVPVAASFPYRVEGAEARVMMQQGESEGSVEVRRLGGFVVKAITPAASGPTTIDCHVTAQPDGSLHFRATQSGRKLKVGWAPIGLQG